MNIPKLVKYAKGKADCPKCHGMLSYFGSGTVRLPLGLGFAPGDPRFRIDTAQFKGWAGECMECGQEVLAWTSKRLVTRFPQLRGGDSPST